MILKSLILPFSPESTRENAKPELAAITAFPSFRSTLEKRPDRPLWRHEMTIAISDQYFSRENGEGSLHQHHPSPPTCWERESPSRWSNDWRNRKRGEIEFVKMVNIWRRPSVRWWKWPLDLYLGGWEEGWVCSPIYYYVMVGQLMEQVDREADILCKIISM